MKSKQNFDAWKKQNPEAFLSFDFFNPTAKLNGITYRDISKEKNNVRYILSETKCELATTSDHIATFTEIHHYAKTTLEEISSRLELQKKSLIESSDNQNSLNNPSSENVGVASTVLLSVNDVISLKLVPTLRVRIPNLPQKTMISLPVLAFTLFMITVTAYLACLILYTLIKHEIQQHKSKLVNQQRSIEVE